MGVRVFSHTGDKIEVMPFDKRTHHTVWCSCNMVTQQHNLAYGKRPAAPAHDPHFVIELTPAAFFSMVKTAPAALLHFAKKIKSGKTHLFSPQPLMLDAAMQQCISNITHYQESGEGKRMYIYIRIMELLWLQNENYMRAQEPGAVYIKTEYDKERIVFARDYLLTHMDAPPTLVQLAAIAGINEFKLKRGFKEMFNQTVFAYLADVRLEMARRALHEKQKTVTQIAFELGYASLQHFSMAFKKKFGVPPGKY